MLAEISQDDTTNRKQANVVHQYLVSYAAGPTLQANAVIALPQAQDRAALRDLTANLNDRHRNAQFAGRASVELHTLIFFCTRAIAADARIVKVLPIGTWSIILLHTLTSSHSVAGGDAVWGSDDASQCCPLQN